jgi:hypothetical protein
MTIEYLRQVPMLRTGNSPRVGILEARRGVRAFSEHRVKMSLELSSFSTFVSSMAGVNAGKQAVFFVCPAWAD